MVIQGTNYSHTFFRMMWEARSTKESLSFISSLRNMSFISLADFLHVIKNFRSRVLFNIIYPLQSFKTQYLNNDLLLKDIIVGAGTFKFPWENVRLLGNRSFSIGIIYSSNRFK